MLLEKAKTIMLGTSTRVLWLEHTPLQKEKRKTYIEKNTKEKNEMMDSNRGKDNETCIMREIHNSGLEHSNPITQMGL